MTPDILGMTTDPPQAPQCRALHATAITVSWYRYSAVGATQYELHYKPDHHTAWTARPPSADHETTVKDLTPGKWYDFRLRWLDAQGRSSPWSATTFCWTLPDPVFSLGVDIEAYRQWVCQCSCTGCYWYQPCGTPACRPQAHRRLVVAVNGGHDGFFDDMAVAVLDAPAARELGQALLDHAPARPPDRPATD